MADNLLSILIKAKNEASKVFKDVSKDADKMDSTMGKVGHNMKLGLAVGAAAGGAAIIGAGIALKGFVQMAADEQVGIERLSAALKNVGVDYKSRTLEIENVIRAGERLAFSDDEVRESLGNLTTATGSYEEAQKRQKIAMDLARGTGMDLVLASKLVGKVSEENTQVLKKYGITLKDGATEQEALAEIQKRFAGQSEAYANTAAGKWKIFGQQMDNVKESIGSALLPVVTQLGDALGKFLLDHQDEIDAFALAMSEKIPKAIAAIVDAFNRVRPQLEHIFTQMREGFQVLQPALQWIIANKPALLAALVAIGAAMLLAFSPVTLPILAVVAAIGALLFILGTSKAKWEAYGEAFNKLWEDMQAIIEEKLGIFGTFLNAALDSWRNIFETGFKVIRDVVIIVMALLQGDWSRAWEGLQMLVRDVLTGIVTELSIRFGLIRDLVAWGFATAKALAADAMQGMLNAVVYIGAAVINWFADLPGRITSKLRTLSMELFIWGVNIAQGFIDGIKNMATAVGNAVWDALTEPFKEVAEFFGFGSPSRMMAQYGTWIGEGFVNGIASQKSSIAQVLNDIAAMVAERMRQASQAAAAIGSAAGTTSRQGEGPRTGTARVGGRTRDEWKYIFGASGIPPSEYEPRLREMFGYARGTAYVPHTGIAMVHQGEAVLSKESADMFRSLLRGGGGRQVVVNVTINGNADGRQVVREIDRYFRGAA